MLTGERVRLRGLEMADLERLHGWINDPEVTQYMGMVGPVSLEAERRWLERDVDAAREARFAIESVDGRHIGSCALHVGSEINRAAELGIMIGEKDCWGQGYGSDAIVTLCGYGFRQLNLHRIALCVFDFNARGARCYEKAGFQVEGRRREAVYKHGAYHDIILMSILRSEYAAKFPDRWA